MMYYIYDYDGNLISSGENKAQAIADAKLAVPGDSPLVGAEVSDDGRQGGFFVRGGIGFAF